jgi:hypothetical protein
MQEVTAADARKLSTEQVRSLLTKENERNSMENNTNILEVVTKADENSNKVK